MLDGSASRQWRKPEAKKNYGKELTVAECFTGEFFCDFETAGAGTGEHAVRMR
jgi:hypothetical protein